MRSGLNLRFQITVNGGLTPTMQHPDREGRGGEGRGEGGGAVPTASDWDSFFYLRPMAASLFKTTRKPRPQESVLPVSSFADVY